ncbi:MAG: hypothetical protein RLN70_09835, partial [Rhodospirillaceae bacterium]
LEPGMVASLDEVAMVRYSAKGDLRSLAPRTVREKPKRCSRTAWQGFARAMAEGAALKER